MDCLLENEAGEYSDQERSKVIIVNNALHIHRVLRLNYTTYDVRRDQDVINPRTRSDVILLPPDAAGEEHPYQYGRIDAIFHVIVEHVGRDSQTSRQQILDVCWVKRYAVDTVVKGGFKEKRMHRVGPTGDDDRWGYVFIDPKHIVCAAHLVPVFAEGEIGGGIDEYYRYYVNPYVIILLLIWLIHNQVSGS